MRVGNSTHSGRSGRTGSGSSASLVATFLGVIALTMGLLVGVVASAEAAIAPDPQFNDNIGSTLNNEAYNVTLDSEGRSVVTGAFTTPSHYLARFNADGTPDTAFNSNIGTTLDSEAYAATVDGSGGILVVGEFTSPSKYLARFNADGTPDTAFNSNIGTIFDGNPTYAAAIDDTGRIVVGGEFSAPSSFLARFNGDGTPDTAFNAQIGATIDAPVSTVGFDSQGGIVVGGLFGAPGNHLARFNSDGTPDTAFNTAVAATINDWAFHLVLDNQGRIVVGGDFTTPANFLARFNADGTPDIAFNTAVGATLDQPLNSVAVDDEGSVLTAGFFSAPASGLARFTPDGTPDTQFNTEVGSTLDGFGWAAAPTADRAVIVAGMFTNPSTNLAKFDGNPLTPAAPTALVAAAGDESASIAFTAGYDGGEPVTNYEYSLNGSAWAALVPATANPPIAITGLTNGTPYDVRLRAVNTNGAGTPSQVVAVTPSTIPPAPTGLAATPGDGQLTVSFTQSEDGGLPISNYEYSLDGGAWTAFTPVQVGSPVSISGLTNGTEYIVALRAVNANGVSSTSPSVSGVPATVPPAPTAVSGQRGDGQAVVSFTQPGDGGAAISNYEYSIDGGTSWVALDPAQTTSPVTVSGLTNGTTYDLALRAINAMGAGDTSTTVSVTPAGVPTAPTNVVANAGVGSVAVSFTSSDANGDPITNYEYSLDGGSTWQAFTPPVTAPPAIITGAPVGVQAEVSLRAVNGVGPGAASIPVPVTPAGVPGPLEALLALPLDGGVGMIFGVLNSGGLPLTNFEYSVDGGSTWSPFDPPITNDFGIAFVDGLTNGATQQVTVRAVNAVGAGPAAAVQPVTVGAPFPPFLEDLVPGDESLAIVFDEQIDDNGSPITNLEYSLDGGGTWVSLDPSSTTSPVVVGGLINGQTYEVQLRAVNDRGVGPSSSIIAILDPFIVDTVTVGAPTAPTELSVTPGDGQVTVAFTPGRDNGAPITNYEYSLDDGQTWAAFDPAATGSPVSITGLTNGDNVDFGLRGVNERGSGQGAFTSFTVGVPAAPIDLVATAGNGAVEISFIPGADNGAPITNYSYSTDGGQTWTQFDQAVTGSPVAISGLTNGTEYQIALRASNSRGSGASSRLVTVTPLTTPAAPTGLTAVPGYGEATVAFTAPIDDGGSAITNYEYSTDAGVTWVALDPAVTTSPVTITGLTNGVAYQIGLRAVNAAGAGAASDLTPVTPEGAAFTAVDPFRAYDSRGGDGALAPGQTRLVGTEAPPGAVAVAYNLTATGMTGPGLLEVAPAGSSIGATSTLNYVAAGQTWANAFVSGVDSNGQIEVRAAGSATEFVVDVVGFYIAQNPPVSARATPAVASLFVPIVPQRTYDSRDSGAGGPLAGGQSRTVNVTADGSVPPEATAIAYTLTETGTVGRGYFSVGPAGGTQPAVSNINWFTTNQTTANSSVVAITDGQVDVWAGTSPGGSAEFVVDVLGYYLPGDLAPDAGSFTAIDPERAYDSRVDDPLGPISSGEGFTTSMAVSGVPDDAVAVAFNLTVTGSTASGFLTTAPGDVTAPPVASTINWWLPNQTLANGSVVDVPSAQRIADASTQSAQSLANAYVGLPVTTFAGGGSTQYVIDVAGYFTPNAQS